MQLQLLKLQHLVLEVLTRQINGAIQLHAQVFNFMYERGYYPAYDLKQLLKMMFKMCKGNTNAILKQRYGNYL